MKNGSFPALSSGTPRKAGEEIGNKVEKFPGIPCFRKCKSHCNKLCYAQMSPLQQDFWTNVLASRVHQIENLQKHSRELQQQHAAVDNASAKSTLDDAETLHELDEGIETHRMRIIDEYREAQAINARARTAADTRELHIFKRPEDTV